MGEIRDIDNPWRRLLQTQASFRGVMFHVELGSRASGRRTVLHEYPKQLDTGHPYAEDMGRHARRFHFTGYLIYRPWKEEDRQRNPTIAYDYVERRSELIAALEREGPGLLVHPVFAREGPFSVMCERYAVIETRERGGYTQFDMQFVEAGKPGNMTIATNTKADLQQKAANVEQTVMNAIAVSLG